MAKNVSILVGKEARVFNGINKITTNKPNGDGVVTWIPEDGMEEKTITENGTYKAEDDDCAGYTKVTVNVEGGTGQLITKNITENGTYSAQQDEAYGYSSVTVNVPGGPQGEVYGGVAVEAIPAGSTVYVNYPPTASAVVVSSNIPSGADVGAYNGTIAFYTGGYGGLARGYYSLTDKDAEPTLIRATDAYSTPNLCGPVAILQRPDGSSRICELVHAGDDFGSGLAVGNTNLTNVSAGYLIKSINNESRIISTSSLSPSPGTYSGSGSYHYATSSNEVFQIKNDFTRQISYILFKPIGGTHYPVDISADSGWFFCDNNNTPNMYCCAGDIILSKAWQANNSTRRLYMIDSVGNATLLASGTNMSSVWAAADGSRCYCVVAGTGLVVVANGHPTIYPEITSWSGANICLFGNYFWDGTNLWQLSGDGDYTIGLTNRKDGGDMLGWCPEAIESGAVGQAIVLFL